MTIANVRTKLAEALETVPGLRASEYLTETVNPPHAMFDYSVVPDLTFARGSDLYNFTITVFVGRTADVAAQKQLDLFRDPTSTTGVKYVLENNAALAGVVDYVRVTAIGATELIPVSGVEYLAAQFSMEGVI